MSSEEAIIQPFRVEVDQASRLPALPSIMHDVELLLHSNGSVGVVLIDLEPLSAVEVECGSEVYNQLISRIGAEVEALRHNVIRSDDLLCAVRPYGEQLAFFLQGARHNGEVRESDLEIVVERVGNTLTPRILELTRSYSIDARVGVGCALVLPNSMIQVERLIYRALDQARLSASDYARRINAKYRQRLRDLIVNRQLISYVQPIIQLNGTTQVRAFEALVRGPAGTDLASPGALFKVAADSELLGELDRACLEAALTRLPEVPDGTLLFANVLPPLINDPNFRGRLGRLFSGERDAKNLVLEITEGMAIRSYELLLRGVAELRERGVRIAIDDLGSGHANLEHVVRLRPDFLKLDLSLVRGVHTNPTKQTLIKGMVAVGASVGATVIAEGIEERAESECLKELGVSWGQGYLYARPAASFPGKEELARTMSAVTAPVTAIS